MLSYKLTILTIVCSAVLTRVDCLLDRKLPAIFYPFGADEGDTVARPVDDGCEQVSISSEFPVCGDTPSTNSTNYVCTNGIITYGDKINAYSSTPFPINDVTMIAVYWADVDTRKNDGRVYYRYTTDTNILSRATTDIVEGLASRGFQRFTARGVFIATWHNVTYYGGSPTSEVNSFQAVLITDGSCTLAMLNYGNLTWTHGDASDIPAQIGYNCRGSENYYTVPGSRTSDIMHIGEQTNVARRGRWIVRVDGNRNATCSSPCRPNDDPGTPQFSCPVFSGPTVIRRLWFEFYCTVPVNSTTASDPRARFEVSFVVDNRTIIFNTTTTSRQPTVALHERFLHGHLGKLLTCAVTSYWINSPTTRSRSVASNNSYTPGIQAISYPVGVHETDSRPLRLVFKSTIPVTCQVVDDSGQPKECYLKFSISATDHVALRQRYPGQPKKRCEFLITESDWKDAEKLAYNSNAPVELRAKVYHLDSASPMVRCSSSGDPHFITLDGVSYTVLTRGQFIYMRSTSGIPFEVQMRHWECFGGGVGCICGVAMREDDAILAVDMCTDGVPHIITYGAKNLPNGAGVTTEQSGHSMKIQLPSGAKALLSVADWGMNVDLYIARNVRTEGLCGSFDGNRTNELQYRNSDRVVPLSALLPATGYQAPDDFIDSWRVPRNVSLFDGRLDTIARGDPEEETPATYCTCNGVHVCGGFAVTDNSTSAWEPNLWVEPKIPFFAVPSKRKRRAVIGVEPTDRVDYSYNPKLFNQSSAGGSVGQWPVNGITESEARNECRRRIVNRDNMGPSCYSKLANSENTTKVVDKCVADTRLTGDGDYLLAGDKVAELQLSCIDEVLARNRSNPADNVTSIEQIVGRLKGDLEDVTDYRCAPFDCSGHGNCSRGNCVCDRDYIGADCAVSRSAVPSIQRLLDPRDCDIRRQLCLAVNMITANRTSNVTGTVEVSAPSDAKTRTYPAQCSVTSLMTTRCELPEEPLNWFSSRVNFTAVGGSGIYFSQLPPGAAVLTYSLSLSNDGQQFGEPQTLRVVDSLCMDCDSKGCTQKVDSCIINGYGFAASARNPYNPDCCQCQPSKSRTEWSVVSHAANGQCDPCSCVTCPPDLVKQSIADDRCVCVPVSTAEPPTTETTRRSTPTTAPTTTTSTTTTATRSNGWTYTRNWNSFYGTFYPQVSNVEECQRLCEMNLDCRAIDVDNVFLDKFCWLHTDRAFTNTGGDCPGVDQYVLDRSLVPCFGARWKTYSGVGLYGPFVQSDITTLADCQQRCIANVSCSGISFTFSAPSDARCHLLFATDVQGARAVGRVNDHDTWQLVVVRDAGCGFSLTTPAMRPRRSTEYSGGAH